MFSGSQDILKVYGWEPGCTYDSVVSGWGKVSDMTMTQNQLVSKVFILIIPVLFDYWS